MRGFRGSRAAAQLNSRFDRYNQKRMEKENFLKLVSNNQQQQQRALPDWVKTPETRAREAAEAKGIQPAGPSHLRLVPQPAPHVPAAKPFAPPRHMPEPVKPAPKRAAPRKAAPKKAVKASAAKPKVAKAKTKSVKKRKAR